MRKIMTDHELKIKSLEYIKKMLKYIKQAGAGHTGGSLSCIDILNVLYNRILNVTPENFKGTEQKKMNVDFVHIKVIKIENFDMDGELKTLEEQDIQNIAIERFPLESVLEVYGDAINRIEIDEE